jgi:hypothetical protein
MLEGDEQQKALKERFSQMSDEELLKIVCEDYEDYHETALQVAEAELNICRGRAKHTRNLS